MDYLQLQMYMQAHKVEREFGGDKTTRLRERRWVWFGMFYTLQTKLQKL